MGEHINKDFQAGKEYQAKRTDSLIDNAYNAGLEKAASWIVGYADSDSAYDTKTFAKNMADSIRAQKISEPNTYRDQQKHQLVQTQVALLHFLNAIEQLTSM